MFKQLFGKEDSLEYGARAHSEVEHFIERTNLETVDTGAYASSLVEAITQADDRGMRFAQGGRRKEGGIVKVLNLPSRQAQVYLRMDEIQRQEEDPNYDGNIPTLLTGLNISLADKETFKTLIDEGLDQASIKEYSRQIGREYASSILGERSAFNALSDVNKRTKRVRNLLAELKADQARRAIESERKSTKRYATLATVSGVLGIGSLLYAMSLDLETPVMTGETVVEAMNMSAFEATQFANRAYSAKTPEDLAEVLDEWASTQGNCVSAGDLGDFFAQLNSSSDNLRPLNDDQLAELRRSLTSSFFPYRLSDEKASWESVDGACRKYPKVE